MAGVFQELNKNQTSNSAARPGRELLVEQDIFYLASKEIVVSVIHCCISSWLWVHPMELVAPTAISPMVYTFCARIKAVEIILRIWPITFPSSRSEAVLLRARVWLWSMDSLLSYRRQRVKI